MSFTVRVRTEKLVGMMTCLICNKLYRDATTIPECLHTFCKKCIHKLVDEGLAKCPVCDTDLGCSPLEKLRPDRNLQDMRAKIFPLTKKKVNTSEASPLKEKTPESSPSVTPLRVKERSLSSLGVDTPRVSPQNSTTGQGTKLTPRKVSSLCGPSFDCKKEGSMADANSSNGHKRAVPIWFSLEASEDQEGGAQLTQISANYLRVTDGTMPVSFIQKYLAKKLDLADENEVEIKCVGQSVIPTLQLNSLVEMWVQSHVILPRVSTSVGSPATDFVMVLSYARRGPSP